MASFIRLLCTDVPYLQYKGIFAKLYRILMTHGEVTFSLSGDNETVLTF